MVQYYPANMAKPDPNKVWREIKYDWDIQHK
jgi:hypothetical protein